MTIFGESPEPAVREILDVVLAHDEPAQRRVLDAFLAYLKGWNLDWTDPREIERVGVPGYSPAQALEILVGALAAGELGRRPRRLLGPSSSSRSRCVARPEGRAGAE